VVQIVKMTDDGDERETICDSVVSRTYLNKWNQSCVYGVVKRLIALPTLLPLLINKVEVRYTFRLVFMPTVRLY
jgi:hypothetical protein